MADLSGFDANQVDPSSGFDPIPAGKYVAVIVESEMKPTKSGNGHYLQLAFQVTEGGFKGRMLWARLNLDNPNSTAVEIARSELSAICRAVGVMRPKDSLELHNLPLVIGVRCKKRADTDEITNEISGYAEKGQPTPAMTSAPARATSAANPSTPPWRRER